MYINLDQRRVADFAIKMVVMIHSIGKKKKPLEVPEIIPPGKYPEREPVFDPEEPLVPEEDPDIIPEEDPYETPPYEYPPPAEGP